MLEEWAREMQEQQGDRQHWIEARTAVAQELLRAHAIEPTPSLYHLQKSIHADDRLFDAAVNHLIDTGRLPRNFPRSIKKAVAEQIRERLLARLVSHGGCATDADSLRAIVDIDDPQQVKSVIDSLVKSNCIIATSEHIFLSPDDTCLTAVLEEVPTPRFSMSDIAGTEAVVRYADRSGVATDQAAQIVAQTLERQSKIVSIAEGEYRSRSTVAAAVRRIRAMFQEYRPYDTNEIVATVKTDEQTLRHVLADLQRSGSLRKSGDAAFKPTRLLSSRGWPCCECGTRTRLKQLTPERFELLLANRFEAMGLCVQLIGRTNAPDGGIDLIAYPDPHLNQPKYLLAVQAEHHRTERKTGAPKVQKFVGAMSAVPPFRLGFVVTNTTFTWTAINTQEIRVIFFDSALWKTSSAGFAMTSTMKLNGGRFLTSLSSVVSAFRSSNPSCRRCLSDGTEMSTGDIALPRTQMHQRTNG